MRGIYPLVSEKGNKKFVGAYPHSFKQVKNKEEKEIKSMKRMKRIVSLALAVIMALAMTTTTFAANNNEYAITINGNANDKSEHYYAAYQIFAGDLSKEKVLKCDNTEEGHVHNDTCYEEKADAKFVLSNIIWGSGVDGTAILSDLKTEADDDSEAIKNFKKAHKGDLDKCNTAADVAAFISQFASSDKNSSGDIDVFASIVSRHLTNDYAINGNGTDADMSKIHVLGSGYYMIKDMDATQTGNDDSAYTRLLLEVVGNATVNVKSEVPSGEKKIFYWGTDAYDLGHTHTDECYQDGDLICGKVEYKYDPSGNKGDANNAGIGDHVTFEITSKVPNYVGYDYYYFIMNDTMSDGLTFDGGDYVQVKIGNDILTRGTVGELVCTEDHEHSVDGCYGELICTETENHIHDEKCYGTKGDYYVYESDDHHSFRLAFKDIMETATDNNGQQVQKWAVGSDVIVTYSATVNKDAVIGTSGNKNAWSLEYSKNPNFDYGGKNNSKTPGLPVDDDENVFGKTPEDITLTYVTELDITKYANGTDLTDVKNYLLQGAEFTLTGTSYQVVANNVEYYKESANGTYYKLMDGTYTTTPPTGTKYTEIGVGTESTQEGYLMRITDGEEEYYLPDDTTEYNGKTIYKLSKGTAENYADVNTKYELKNDVTFNLVPVEVSIELTTGADGKISFSGLGAGKYTLTETITPEGFNTIEPIEFEIGFEGPKNADGELEVSTGEEKCKWTISWDDAKDTTLQYIDGNPVWDTASGIFAANVINNSGSLLPSTGGIGTTIFYVVGAILVIGAGILLVAKKRMSNR